MFNIDILTKEESEAARRAGGLLAMADLDFMMVVCNDDGRGAILCNIEPDQAVGMLETILGAVKAAAEAHEQGKEPLQ